MDINFYLAREQTEQVLARAAISPEARAAHSGLAASYRAMIERHRTTPAKTALARNIALRAAPKA